MEKPYSEINYPPSEKDLKKVEALRNPEGIVQEVETLVTRLSLVTEKRLNAEKTEDTLLVEILNKEELRIIEKVAELKKLM